MCSARIVLFFVLSYIFFSWLVGQYFFTTGLRPDATPEEILNHTDKVRENITKAVNGYVNHPCVGRWAIEIGLAWRNSTTDALVKHGQHNETCAWGLPTFPEMELSVIVDMLRTVGHWVVDLLVAWLETALRGLLDILYWVASITYSLIYDAFFAVGDVATIK